MKTKSLLLYYAAAMATLGSFLQGYVMCVIAGALSSITEEFQMTSLHEGLAASTVFIGALAGATFSGVLADRLGRKKSLLITAFFYMLFSLLILLVNNFATFLILRLAIGVIAGMTSILVPMYLAEIAPASTRGAFVTLFQLTLTVGTLAAYCVNAAFVNWRWMLLVAAIPAAVQFFGLFFVSETHQSSGSHKISWRLVFPSYRFTLVLGLSLSLVQQLVGANAIIVFAPKLFSNIGFSNAMIPTLGLGVVNTLATLASAFLIDRFGRRKLYLSSLGGVGMGLIFLAIASLFLPPWATLLSCMIYIISSSLGLGPVTWVLISEIYPTAIRAKIIAMLVFFNWAASALVVMTFPLLFTAWGISGACALYLLFVLGSFLFFFRAIPETKGKSLEQLASILYPDQSKKS